jgi:hypothetical protein
MGQGGVASVEERVRSAIQASVARQITQLAHSVINRVSARTAEEREVGSDRRKDNFLCRNLRTALRLGCVDAQQEKQKKSQC